MRNISEALKLLGTRQIDVVTGFKGVITSICFDINGCIQGAVKPPLDDLGKLHDAMWVDLDRLRPNGEPVCPPFPYEVTRAVVPGPADKPAK